MSLRTHGSSRSSSLSLPKLLPHLHNSAVWAANFAMKPKFVPGPGTYSYRAELVEGGFGLASVSAASSLTVGPAPSVVYSDNTAITASGSPGDYTLTATVVGYGGPAAPTGD